MTDQLRDRTPGLTQVIENAINKKLFDVHTALPGEIISYDASTNLAVIQPMIKRKYIFEDNFHYFAFDFKCPCSIPKS